MGWIYVVIVLLATACQKTDNYTEPQETLTGSLIDVETGEPIFTEQPDGTRIKLLQTDWNDNPTPQYFWVKPDGTFRNTKIFNGTYEVSPVDGPFVPVAAPENVTIKGVVNVDFKVMPFLRVKLLNVTLTGNKALVQYKIERPQGSFKITDAWVFVSTTNQATNASFDNKLSVKNDLQSIDDAMILATTYTTEVTLTAGRTFYLRVGARSNDNVSRRYNYTDVREVTVPQ
ncbi:Protein of unknown function [bacterium A37T11]|nr:Protein of unknown function [bacterium A37T11]